MKLAWLVCGLSGSGKSTWIRKRAEEIGAKLLHHAVRTDRSLRQGRAFLFSQHRSKEKTLIWLEGADTLTTDAQAFLRRILETATPNVEFALEVRNESTINPPLLSRCQRILMPPIQYRKQNAIQTLERRGYADIRKSRHAVAEKAKTWNPGTTFQSISAAILQARQQGLFPDVLLHSVLQKAPVDVQVDTYRKLGDGCSPWILLTDVLMHHASGNHKTE